MQVSLFFKILFLLKNIFYPAQNIKSFNKKLLNRISTERLIEAPKHDSHAWSFNEVCPQSVTLNVSTLLNLHNVKEKNFKKYDKYFDENKLTTKKGRVIRISGRNGLEYSLVENNFIYIYNPKNKKILKIKIDFNESASLAGYETFVESYVERFDEKRLNSIQQAFLEFYLDWINFEKNYSSGLFEVFDEDESCFYYNKNKEFVVKKSNSRGIDHAIVYFNENLLEKSTPILKQLSVYSQMLKMNIPMIFNFFRDGSLSPPNCRKDDKEAILNFHFLNGLLFKMSNHDLRLKFLVTPLDESVILHEFGHIIQFEEVDTLKFLNKSLLSDNEKYLKYNTEINADLISMIATLPEYRMHFVNGLLDLYFFQSIFSGNFLNKSSLFDEKLLMEGNLSYKFKLFGAIENACRSIGTADEFVPVDIENILINVKNPFYSDSYYGNLEGFDFILKQHPNTSCRIRYLVKLISDLTLAEAFLLEN